MDEYYKLMESMLLKVRLQFESEEEKVARFVSGLRRSHIQHNHATKRVS